MLQHFVYGGSDSLLWPIRYYLHREKNDFETLLVRGGTTGRILQQADIAEADNNNNSFQYIFGSDNLLNYKFDHTVERIDRI